jgi:hypothetical protein
MKRSGSKNIIANKRYGLYDLSSLVIPRAGSTEPNEIYQKDSGQGTEDGL